MPAAAVADPPVPYTGHLWVDRLMAMPRARRQAAIAALSTHARQQLAAILDDARRNPWHRWRDDPEGFITEGLSETVWSKQAEICRSVRDNKRTAVPACHAPGKSHLAARIVAWWISSHPPGTAMAVTTATTFRQVRNILWPHIRRVHARHGLPGTCLLVEWSLDGNVAAYGFSASKHDEAAAQGIHAPHLLVVVDEAGGIGDTLGGALEALMTGGHTRLLLLGNPPTDQEGSWFERACASVLYTTIPISAYDTPNFTAEDAGRCMACPPGVDPHPVAEHLVDATWVADVIEAFGADSAFVEARVHARFPRMTARRVLPIDWVEEASKNEGAGTSTDRTIRLGVDVASDGGDEMVIARADGFHATVLHASSGPANASALHVAEVILEHIVAAQADLRAKGRVRVKVDAIGLGWGVCGLLDEWRQQGRHQADIVPVNVAERAGDPERFVNQRAEMWWTTRALIQPDAEGRQLAHLDVDHVTQAQLSAPEYKANSAGQIVIESKAVLKRRGQRSPDRAEAILLALYEPPFAMDAVPVAPQAVGGEPLDTSGGVSLAV